MLALLKSLTFQGGERGNGAVYKTCSYGLVPPSPLHLVQRPWPTMPVSLHSVQGAIRELWISKLIDEKICAMTAVGVVGATTADVRQFINLHKAHFCQ